MKNRFELSLELREQHFKSNHPIVMGILNTTPDSFSDGGKFQSVEAAIAQVDKLIHAGASIIDVGGESTRPGADPVSEQEEIDRVIPVMEQAIPKFPDILFSIDTTKYRVADEALKRGAHIVNDVSGLTKEPRLADLCAKYNAGYILMHSQGDPKTMQKNPSYDDLMSEISFFFEEGIKKLRKKGVQTVIIDPGMGFGKLLSHNLELIANLSRFKKLKVPIMVGASRKAMIGQILDGRPASDRLTGTIAVHYHCLMNGADILRVHDVKEAIDSVKVYNSLRGFSNHLE